MKRAFGLIVLCLLTVSCSRMDWAFRWADTYVMWEADSFFDLTAEQKKEFKPQVQQALGDVKRSVLPLTAGLMDEIGGDLAGDVDEAKMRAWFDKGRLTMRQGLKSFEPVSVAFARRATPAQDEHFASKFRERIEEKREQVATPAKALKADLKRMKGWFDFFGVTMTPEQKSGLEDFLKRNPTPYEAQFKMRERLLGEFLRTRGEERVAWIQRFYAAPEVFRSAEEKKIFETREAALRRYLQELWTGFTEKQKSEFKEAIKEKAAELRKISRQG